MEVSAKTGYNVKEFFKDLAFLTAGGKKTKDEPAAKTQTSAPAQPANNVNTHQGVNLTKSAHEQKDKKKGKGCC